jgi:hypothetical protein
VMGELVGSGGQGRMFERVQGGVTFKVLGLYE